MEYDDDDKNVDMEILFHIILYVTAFFYGCLVLFFKFGGNTSTNPIYPFIRISCKWSFFTWIFYFGIVLGRKWSEKLIKELRKEQKNLERKIAESRWEKNDLKDEIITFKENFEKQEKKARKIEFNLMEKLKKYERTTEKATSDALENFL